MPIWIISSFHHVVSIHRSIDLNLNFQPVRAIFSLKKITPTKNIDRYHFERWMLSMGLCWCLKSYKVHVNSINFIFARTMKWVIGTRHQQRNASIKIVNFKIWAARLPFKCSYNWIWPKWTKSNRSWTWGQIKWIYEKPVILKWISQPSP